MGASKNQSAISFGEGLTPRTKRVIIKSAVGSCSRRARGIYDMRRKGEVMNARLLKISSQTFPMLVVMDGELDYKIQVQKTRPLPEANPIIRQRNKR